MKIAIVGKSGCGKTTLTKLFDPEERYTIICCDEIVHQHYKDLIFWKEGYLYYNFFNKNFKECFSKEHDFDCSKLEDIVIKNHFRREQLEDFFYNRVFRPLIVSLPNIIVDGIIPRFTNKLFDIVLYAYVPKKERVKRLLGRGMSKQRIEEIDSIQKGWKFPLD